MKKQYLGQIIQPCFEIDTILLDKHYGFFPHSPRRPVRVNTNRRISIRRDYWNRFTLEQYTDMLTGCAQPKGHR